MFFLNRKFSVLLPLLSLPIFVSCHKDEEPKIMTIDRTVLVYMASNSNLSSYTEEDFKGITKGYLPEWFDNGNGDVLLAYVHLYGSKPNLLRLSKREGVACIDTLLTYSSQNSCSSSVFKKVLNDAFGSYNSAERGLILSSHGTGWLPNGYYYDPIEYAPAACAAPSRDGVRVPYSDDSFIHYQLPDDPYAWMVKSFGYDAMYDSEMNIEDLKAAIDYKMDYILFDCCLMGGVEVAYEMKDKSDYIIFSQTEILADGFPYEGVMQIAFQKDTDVPARAAAMARLYYDYYDARTDETFRSATISVVKTSELNALSSAVRNIMDAGGRTITESLPCSDGKVTNVQQYFRFDYHWFYDLDDYMYHIAPSTALYDSFTDALGKAVIYKAATPYFLKYAGGFEIKHFSGLSIWIDRPQNRYLEQYYAGLDWGAAISEQVTAPL